ncbi:MAG: hypothetical protein V4719_09370 [Planctomycetota bacterium]
MKTEHRHELKANDLQEVAVKVETFYERHAASLQWGIIGAAFLIACGIYYWRTTSALEAAAWNELSQSQSAEAYAQVASDFSGSKAAAWAKLREANSYLETYLRDSFENREKANTDLKKAKDILAGLVAQNGPQEFKQQAMFAYARNLEMSSDGDLKPAIAAYENLIKEIPDTIFKREAEERIRTLNSPSAKEFYAFFSKQNPKPAAPPKPNDAKKGGDPFKTLTPGLGELIEKAASGTGEGGVPFLSPPKLPEVTVPDDSKPAEKPAADAPKTDEPKTEKPATEPEPKAEEKPAAEAEKKAEEKPAAEPEKKAEEKPAETPADKKPE